MEVKINQVVLHLLDPGASEPVKELVKWREEAIY